MTVTEAQLTESTWWWLLGGILVALELMSGTFLLLMLAAGAVAGAIAAHLSLALPYQITTASVVGAAAVFIWVRFLRRSGQQTGEQHLANQTTGQANLDLGQTVTVTAWTADGTAQVHYRGAPWSARYQANGDPTPPTPGVYRICDVQGNVLIVQRHP